LAELLGWSGSLAPERLWALEDCRQLTRTLEETLLAAGERLVRVPPKLMAPQRRAGRMRGKSDPIDALAVARGALREPRLDHPRPGERRLRELKLLVDHRDDLIDERRSTTGALVGAENGAAPRLARGRRVAAVRTSRRAYLLQTEPVTHGWSIPCRDFDRSTRRPRPPPYHGSLGVSRAYTPGHWRACLSCKSVVRHVTTMTARDPTCSGSRTRLVPACRCLFCK
jgi:hypothetical protein